MRNLEKMDEINERTKLDEISKQGCHSNEKTESSRLNYHKTVRSPTRKGEYRHSEKKLVKETSQSEIGAFWKENSINVKEIKNSNTADIKTDTTDANPEEWKKVLPRRKKSQKHVNLSRKTCKTDKNVKESFSQTKHDRIESSEHRRTYSNDYQQKQVLKDISDKTESYTEPIKKYSNLRKNVPVQYSAGHPSNESRHLNLNEASAETCISTPNEKFNTSSVQNRTSEERVTEATPEKSFTKTLAKCFRHKNSKKYQFRSKGTFPETLTGQRKDKIFDSTMHEKEPVFNNQNTEKQVEKIGSEYAPKQCNSQNRTALNQIHSDILKNKTIQQTQLNIYAKEFSPPHDKYFNRRESRIKNQKEQRKEIPLNCSNAKNLNDEITENAESINLIKKIESIEINAAHNATSSETNGNLLSESLPKIQENKFDQEAIVEQFRRLSEQSFNNEEPRYGNFAHSNDSDQSDYNAEFSFNVFTELAQYDHLNYFFTYTTDLINGLNLSLVFQQDVNGTVYFYTYPYFIFDDCSWSMLLYIERRTNT